MIEKEKASIEREKDMIKQEKDILEQAVDRNRDESPPVEYMCPILFELMTDPVICADGFSYERRSIETWLRNHDTSPKTREKMSRNLIPNFNLKILIQEWETAHGTN
jgi:hypothetical protein